MPMQRPSGLASAPDHRAVVGAGDDGDRPPPGGGGDDAVAPPPRLAQNEAGEAGPPERKRKPKKKKKVKENSENHRDRRQIPKAVRGVAKARRLKPNHPPPDEALTSPDAFVRDAARDVIVAYLRRGRAEARSTGSRSNMNPEDGGTGIRHHGHRAGIGDGTTNDGDPCSFHAGSVRDGRAYDVLFEFGTPRSGGDGIGTDGVYNRILKHLGEESNAEANSRERRRPRRPQRRSFPQTASEGDDGEGGCHPRVGVGGGAVLAAGDEDGDIDRRRRADDADVFDRAFASWFPRGARRRQETVAVDHVVNAPSRASSRGGAGGGDGGEEKEWTEGEEEEEEADDSENDNGPVSQILHRHRGHRHRHRKYQPLQERARDYKVDDDGNVHDEESQVEEEEDSDDDRPISQLHRRGTGGGMLCRRNLGAGTREVGIGGEGDGDGIGNCDSDSDDDLPISQLHSRARDVRAKGETISEHHDGRGRQRGGCKKKKRSRNIIASGRGDKEFTDNDVDEDGGEDNVGDGGEYDDDDEDDEDYEDDGDYIDDDDYFDDDVVPIPRLGRRKKGRRR